MVEIEDLVECRRKSMFIVRTFSGIILLLISIVTGIYGGNLLLTLVGIISILGQYELYRIINLEKSSIALVGYLYTIGLDIILATKNQVSAMPIIILMLIILMVVYVFTYPKYKYKQISMVFVGFLYVSVMLSFIYQVRIAENGIFAIWLIYIAAWGSDTCAYCVGMLIGKHKLPTELSPKKSIEGCIGGVVGAAFIGFLYGMILKNQVSGLGDIQIQFAIIGGVGAVLSQIGDLAASAIKRNYGKKDYGNLIPGHGGILDRFDSIIFTAPIVYLCLMIL